jgi:hypothetical protein
MKYPKPKLFKPTEKEVREALNKVSEYLGTDKEISSADYPELKERGRRKNN